MILISHRGNISGQDKENENAPDYISHALTLVANVEIDVWYYKNAWYLGHDEPQYRVGYEFLTNPKFWCHAKNYEALFELKKK